MWTAGAYSNFSLRQHSCRTARRITPLDLLDSLEAQEHDMQRFPRVLATVVAVALASVLAPISTAFADVATVKRVSCPSVADINLVLPLPDLNPPVARLEATPTTCEYWMKGTPSRTLKVEFVDGASTPRQAEDHIRATWPPASPSSFDPLPVRSLGNGAFGWGDGSPTFIYWQFSPGAVALMSGLYGHDDLAPVAKLFRPMMEVYTIAGERTVNGRTWRTTCENYSATARCRTDIFATTIKKTATGYQSVNDWVFNSLTYRWSDRALWKNNPLGNTGEWTSAEGRKWRTECDTLKTGRGACRSYIWTSEISRKGVKYVQNNVWRFNNQVLFTS